jgi:hypothetical protein
MTPDELEHFEEDIVQGSERTTREGTPPKEDDPMLDVTPDDEDGLPDDVAKFRVPS